MFGPLKRKYIICVVMFLSPAVVLADDIEKLTAQNEYLVSQVVELRKKVKEYALAESLLKQQVERERQRVAEESANVEALSQQVVELKSDSKKLETAKSEAEMHQKLLAESQARLTAEVSRLTSLADDLTKQLKEKTSSLDGQQSATREMREELENVKRQYSKVNAELAQCGTEKQSAAAEISKLNEQLRSAQTSVAGMGDKDREIVRLKNDILLKDSLLNSLGSKTPSTAMQPATPAGKQANRAIQEKQDELFKQSGEQAGNETTGRKKISVPTGKGGDAIQINPDMESFGTIPGNKAPAARGGTVDRAFEKLKGDLERRKGAAEVTPGL